MNKLLIFSDMDGTIDRAGIADFINLFDLVGKYCDKKGYDDFSFNIVTGAGDNCRTLYTETFLFIKKKTGRDISHQVFTGLSSEDKLYVIDSVVSSEALPKDYNEEVDDDIELAKEVIFFDDCPHESLKGDTGKEFFECQYDIEYTCVIPSNNINSLISHFEEQLTKDDAKSPFKKVNN